MRRIPRKVSFVKKSFLIWFHPIMDCGEPAAIRSSSPDWPPLDMQTTGHFSVWVKLFTYRMSFQNIDDSRHCKGRLVSFDKCSLVYSMPFSLFRAAQLSKCNQSSSYVKQEVSESNSHCFPFIPVSMSVGERSAQLKHSEFVNYSTLDKLERFVWFWDLSVPI